MKVKTLEKLQTENEELRELLKICKYSISWHMKVRKATNMDDCTTIPAIDKILSQTEANYES